MGQLLDGQAKGVFIISVTPFTEGGAVDWDSVPSLVEFYLGSGVSGITILGMMGEAQKLGDVEAGEFVNHVLAAVKGRVPVVVGASNAGIDNVVHLGRSAIEAGAAGLMIAPPTGLKTEEQTAGYFKSLTGRLGNTMPLVFQDYPFSTGVNISAGGFIRLAEDCPSIVMLKHEDWPGLRKLSEVRRLAETSAKLGRRISILCGNGGLYLPQELRRGADGAMTGFAYPEMLVGVVALALEGRLDDAEDLFDIYLPLVRHEQQPGIGLAIRKEILRRRGAIRSAAARAPGPKLDADDVRELDTMIARLERRLEAASDYARRGKSGVAPAR
jgi:4-hydroxy-tetrahydrodipicolinate synthase